MYQVSLYHIYIERLKLYLYKIYQFYRINKRNLNTFWQTIAMLAHLILCTHSITIVSTVTHWKSFDIYIHLK